MPRTDRDAGRPDGRDDHLDELDDGCGCVEVWEALSERRSDD